MGSRGSSAGIATGVRLVIVVQFPVGVMYTGRIKPTIDPFIVEVKNEWNYNSTPSYALMAGTETTLLLLLKNVLTACVI